MFTKLRFQSRSKKFWNPWLIKQLAIIVRSRLINTHIRIRYHLSTFSEYCGRSTRQFGTNVINQTFWCVSISLLNDLCSPVATGAFGGLAPQTKLQAPQIEL